ncbi:MAG: hypothetical protein K2G51_15680 [Lachnospiraceae bacterium]|nr:hypothetical protein [Lachnospiraceae bacterium]MDE7272194.1 hypothetical protein [Lachnospiraceae bacterium]
MGNIENSAYLIGTVVGALFAGALIGLIPFFLGRKWGKQRLGTVGLVVCILCNFLLGIWLSIPACLIIIVVMLLTRK